MTTRTCPRCEHHTTARECCGIDLAARRAVWTMTPQRIRAVRAFAHGTKGLDDETFRLCLSRAGVQHTQDLTRDQHRELLQALGRLPDAVRAKARA